MDNINKLQSMMVKYRDLVGIAIKETAEDFVTINSSEVPNGYIKSMTDTKKLFGPRIIVRKSVAKKLKDAQQILKNKDQNLSLYVTYGYRSLETQTARFLKQFKQQSKVFFPNHIDLYEEVHRFVAVPTVAGHPTGGAIDVTIKDLKTKKFLDFGSKQYNYSTKNSYVFTDNISKKAKENRMILRDILNTVGFAPFDGEWWHFSYGDREWAYFYKKNYAIYSQIDSKKVKIQK